MCFAYNVSRKLELAQNYRYVAIVNAQQMNTITFILYLQTIQAKIIFGFFYKELRILNLLKRFF